MFADQFKLTIVVDHYPNGDLMFQICYAEEGSQEWVLLSDYPTRKMAVAFVDGIEFRDSNEI